MKGEFLTKYKTNLNFNGTTYAAEDIAGVNFQDREKVELLFHKGMKFVIDISIEYRKLKELFRKLQSNIKLDPDERQHIITTVEFYNAHEHAFMGRSEETAHRRRELRYIKKMLRKYTRPNEPILDAGCGKGRLTIPLIKSGFNVFGEDLAYNLIMNVKERYPKYVDRFLLGDFTKITGQINNYGAVLMMWHVLTEIKQKMLPTFININRTIRPDGIFIFDIPDVNSDLTKKYYMGDGNDEDFSRFLLKIPALDEIRHNLLNSGFVIKHIKHLKWGIHKYVVLAQKRKHV